MSYEAARAFADTWGLLLLVAIFFAVILYIFRRGSTARYKRASRIPMSAPERPDEAPIESPARSNQKLNDIKDAVRDDPPAGHGTSR